MSNYTLTNLSLGGPTLFLRLQMSMFGKIHSADYLRFVHPQLQTYSSPKPETRYNRPISDKRHHSVTTKPTIVEVAPNVYPPTDHEWFLKQQSACLFMQITVAFKAQSSVVEVPLLRLCRTPFLRSRQPAPLNLDSERSSGN